VCILKDKSQIVNALGWRVAKQRNLYNVLCLNPIGSFYMPLGLAFERNNGIEYTQSTCVILFFFDKVLTVLFVCILKHVERIFLTIDEQSHSFIH
jgi:hypothetical protein